MLRFWLHLNEDFSYNRSPPACFDSRQGFEKKDKRVICNTLNINYLHKLQSNYQSPNNQYYTKPKQAISIKIILKLFFYISFKTKL